MIYLIAYSINEKLYDYSELKEQIKSLGDYQHPMNDVWFISTKYLDEEFETERLRNLLHSERDMIFMTAISRQSVQGWMPKVFWQWLEYVNK